MTSRQIFAADARLSRRIFLQYAVSRRSPSISIRPASNFRGKCRFPITSISAEVREPAPHSRDRAEAGATAIFTASTSFRLS
jgi:hypothetical protein